MALYITNIASLQSRRALTNATNDVNTAMLRLATGLRINSAKDDPAGLQISNRMTSEINGLYQANRNSSDGLAFAQTAEGALDEIVNMLQDIRTKAVQASNGTYTAEDREAIQKEVDQLSAEVTRIAEQTKYGGQTILLGDQSTMYEGTGILTLQVGAYAGDTIDIDMTQSFTLEELDAASVADGGTTILNAEGNIDVSTVDAAQNTLGNIDKLIQVVDSKRGELGASQVRLESIIRNGQNMITNLSDARSRIRDADYAEETANLMNAMIRQQASVAMLLQANAQSNMILQLINASMI